MQYTLVWMQYWSGCSITDCCPKITTTPFQVMDEEIIYLLGKFNIDKDHGSRWMELTQWIMQSPWLQRNSDAYFKTMFK